MKTNLPGWSRWLAFAAGAMDTVTGAGLLVLPAWREVDLLSACLSGVAMLCLAGLLTFVLSRDQSAVVA